MNDKKVVLYKKDDNFTPYIGSPAFVETVNHPDCSNYTGNIVKTTKVISVGEDGTFETQNSVYKPASY